jgi:putative tryptophan/tyrosine transport system substrate-binding protein
MVRETAIGRRRVNSDRRPAIFIAVTLATFGAFAHAADALKALPIVALLNPAPPVTRWSELARNTLREVGYEPGRDVIFIERWASGSLDKLNRDARELARLKIDAIAVGSSAAVRAASQATKTIPIVAIDMESDPVANGWVASLAKPGGNITGFFLDLPEVSAKRLSQLKEIVPRLSRVGVLWDALLDQAPLRATEVAARKLGLHLLLLEVHTPNDIPQAFDTAIRKNAQAMLLMQSPMLEVNPQQIAGLAIRHRLPLAGVFPAHADAGSLLAYGPDVDDLTRRLWIYVGRILKGERPSDLPVQRPNKFDLVLNLKTAEALGVSFPQSFMLQADRVIK